ncbi:hypothetical protein NE237_006244 [Protea cynaroides]|uniref:KIB1-4 beta-propeller domain-containing protein n=1 Tax=Protea cynaroides TaxID=273540 RepID=A0A9Q0KM85_9MAGN|nr:hypothetical protein NE237_006244 [Protea cynaroides]
MASTADWSGLLPELMELILDRLTRISDHLHFISVCSSWKSVTINSHYRRHLPRQLPLLMLPGNDNTETRNFFSLSRGKSCGFHIPEIHRKWCRGSTEGWLIIEDKSNREIQLFDPISRDRILLPQRRPGALYVLDYINKAVLSSNPCKTSDYVILAIVNKTEQLSYYKSGTDRWIAITTRWYRFDDVIFYKGLFYAVGNNASLLIYDFSSQPPMETLIPGRESGLHGTYYLVESLGELLLVIRHFSWYDKDGTRLQHIRTLRFELRKFHESKRKWIRKYNIGDSILFLGYGCSVSVAARNFPECKRNSIYFNDSYSPSKPFHHNDIGVFNFRNRSVESFSDSFPICTTPTFWITPNYPHLLD